MADNKQIAADVLEAIGGKENVSFATNCMTRLRLTLKDKGLANIDEIKQINGVLGCQDVGGQLQIIIGQNVPKVYAEFCDMAGIIQQAAIDENLDKPKEKLTVKKVFGNILDYLSASMVALIPILCAAGLVKAILALFGPDVLGWLAEDSAIYLILDFVYDAGFYFLPIYVGYTAAKKLDVSPTLGMFMGAILIAPDFVEMASNGTALTVLGFNIPVNNYSQSVLPILLTIWIMSYIEKFFKKHIPDTLTTMITPFLTILVTVPISLCLLAPLGSVLGGYIGSFFLFIGEHTGIFGPAIIGAAWEFLVMTGMHTTVITTAIVNYMSVGYDSLVLVGGNMATWAAYGMALGAAIVAKNKNDRSTNLGMFVSGFVGGVTEPVLFGVGMKYMRPFIGMAIGGFAGGLYAGITNTLVYFMASSNFLGVLSFTGGTVANLVNGIIASVISLVVSAVAVAVIGLEPRTKKEKK